MISLYIVLSIVKDEKNVSEESSEGLSTLRVLNEASVVGLNHSAGADGSRFENA